MKTLNHSRRLTPLGDWSLALIAAFALGLFALAPNAEAGNPVIQVSAGFYHTCALLLKGTVKCWGHGGQGQLFQQGTNNIGDDPGEMAALLGANLGPYSGKMTQISAGAYHTCALDEFGNVYCWGRNTEGQLGTTAITAPMAWIGEQAVKVAAGSFHTCALTRSARITCWGENSYGQLGTGDHTWRSIPSGFVNLGTGRTATDLAVFGFASCALLDNRTIKCWGANWEGELGQGDTNERGGNGDMGDLLPVVQTGVDFPMRLSGSSGGGAIMCTSSTWGLNSKCWGSNGGGLAVGTTNPAYGDNPNEMGANLPWTDQASEVLYQVVPGDSFSCARVPGAVVGVFNLKCWGYGGNGMTGQGNTMTLGNSPTTIGNYVAPINLGTGRFAVQVTVGGSHVCALLDDAAVKCWGANFYGQLGQGDTLTRGDGSMPMGDGLPPIDL